MNTADPDQKERCRHESLNIINALRRGTVPAVGLERMCWSTQASSRPKSMGRGRALPAAM